MNKQHITIALSDTTEAREASPDRVRLTVLANFSDDVSVFLKGQTKDVDPDSLHVAVVQGSIALKTEDFIPSVRLLSDLQSLLESPLLDALDAKRREIIEKWQKLARSKKNMAFAISAPFLQRPVVIDHATDYRRDDADHWVRVERYVQGVVTDLGGTVKPNAHIRLKDGTPLVVAADRQQLHDDATNRMYKAATLRVRAEFNVHTRELRNAVLLEFVDYNPTFDKHSFARMTRNGAEAWRGVDSATEWVEQIRGKE